LDESNWELVYYSLIFYQKANDRMGCGKSMILPVEKILKLIEYEHPWVRLCAARIFLSLLNNNQLDFGFKTLISENGIINKMCYTIKTLQDGNEEEEYANVVVEILYLITKYIDENELFHLLKKVSFIARLGSTSFVKKNCFKWIALLINSENTMERLMNSEHKTTFLIPIISPLHRTANDECSKDKDLKNFAEEVMALLETQVENDDFYSARAMVERSIAKVREDRRNERKVQKLVDPETAAKRKLSKNLNKKKAKKRKREDEAKKGGREEGRRRIKV
jgi:hypothetical protein